MALKVWCSRIPNFINYNGASSIYDSDSSESSGSSVSASDKKSSSSKNSKLFRPMSGVSSGSFSGGVIGSTKLRNYTSKLRRNETAKRIHTTNAEKLWEVQQNMILKNYLSNINLEEDNQ